MTKRTIIIAAGTTLTGVALLFAWPTSLNRSVATSTSTSAGTTTSGTTSSGTTTAPPATTAAGTTKTYDGAAASTRFGNVQVRITVAGGVVTAAEAIDYPNTNGRDQQINAYAIPVLNQEAAAARSASISMVSGATYTSRGYVQSLQSALDQAGL